MCGVPTVHDAGLQHRAHQVRGHHGREEVKERKWGHGDSIFETGCDQRNFGVVFVVPWYV